MPSPGTVSLPPLPKEVTGPQPAVSQSDILALTRLVLETSIQHAKQTQSYIKYLLAFIAGLAALASFFGYREYQKIVKPFRDSLDAAKADFDLKYQSQIAETEKLGRGYADQLKLQTEQYERLKEEYVASVNSQIEMSHNNSKALVFIPLILNSLAAAESLKNDIEARQNALRDVVISSDAAMPPNCQGKIDSYLVGLLLMRKAYALKRLGDYASAFKCVSDAIEFDGNKTKDEWFYNHACYAALAGENNICFVSLEEAIKLEPKNRDDASKESDFLKIKDDPRYLALVGVYIGPAEPPGAGFAG